MKYGPSSSKYCYPGTETLINKLNIHDDKLLKKAESLFTGQRLLELSAQALPGNFDLKHLQDIHFYIFQDLYDFAGKIRDEEISKGQTLFAKSEYIVPSAKNLFDELKSENFLLDTADEDFSEKAAYFMAELNIIHPFREGNGRATREFIRCLALRCNYVLNWDVVAINEVLQASIKSIIDTKPLKQCIKKAIANK